MFYKIAETVAPDECTTSTGRLNRFVCGIDSECQNFPGKTSVLLNPPSHWVTIQAPTDVSASKASSQLGRLVLILTSAWRYPTSAVTTAPTSGGPTGATAGRATSSPLTAGAVWTLTSVRRTTDVWVSATMSQAATGVPAPTDTSKLQSVSYWR